MFIHPPLPRVTQSGYNPTSCSLPPKATPSAASGPQARSAAEDLRRLRAILLPSPPTFLQYQAPEAKSRGVSHEPPLPACLRSHSVALWGRRWSTERSLSPGFCPGCTVTPGAIAPGQCLLRRLRDPGSAHHLHTRMRAHIHVHTQKNGHWPSRGQCCSLVSEDRADLPALLSHSCQPP